MKIRIVSLLALLIAGVAHPTEAHIDLERAGTHVAMYAQGPRGSHTKVPPCGAAPDAVATGVSYTYQPGETIRIALSEYVSHPGYFRIAFDDHGDDDFMSPRWIVALDPDRAGGCPISDEDQCRPGDPAVDGDFYNNDTVLMDNLNPHLKGDATTYSWDVTLPDVECDDCVLQIMQVMQDPGGHGVYNTSTDDHNDIYHQCIAMRLERDTE